MLDPVLREGVVQLLLDLTFGTGGFVHNPLCETSLQAFLSCLLVWAGLPVAGNPGEGVVPGDALVDDSTRSLLFDYLMCLN